MLFTPVRRERRNEEKNPISKQPFALTFEHDLFKSNNMNSPSFQESRLDLFHYDTPYKDSHREVSGEDIAFTFQVIFLN